jgi:TetR/AcrR family transcriptional regulator
MARPRSDIEPRIVHAARRRFLKEGVDGASLRMIAKDARTSIGMVYYYFPSKDDLFFAVVEEVYVELLADMTRALEPGAPVPERVRRLYARIGSISDTELAIVKLVVREVLGSSSRFDRLIQRFLRGHIPLVLAALGDGVGDGSIRGDLPPALLFLCTLAVGAVPQLVRRAAGDRLPLAGLPSSDAFAEQLVGVLFHGIGMSSPASERRKSATRPRPR